MFVPAFLANYFQKQNQIFMNDSLCKVQMSQDN